MAVAQQASMETPRFLAGGGEMGQAIAAHDWSATPLGPVAAWPACLKTAIGLVLRSPAAMTLLWGADGTMLYNDAYAAIAGVRQPPCLGLPVADGWPEAADFNRHVVSSVLRGESLSYRDRAFTILRHGRPAQAWFTFDYSPILDEADVPAGVLVLFVETADKLGADERLSQQHERELRDRQILDSAIDYAIIAFDLDGKVTRWNEGARRTLGWTEADMLGQDGSIFFTPEDRAAGRMQAEMQLALAAGAGNDERWHLRQSGERFWGNGEMTPILDANGKATGFVKVLRDRTDQHRAAQVLRESEERLRRAQRAGGVGTFTLHLDSDTLDGTHEFFDIFGVQPARSVPAAVFEALVISEDVPLKSSAATRDRQQAPLDVEYRIRRANDGALRWIARKAEFERDATGKALRLVGVAQDVTERKAAQLAIEESANQFRSFAQALPNHVWTAPADGRLDWFNDRVYDYSGAVRGELDGHGWVQLVHPDDVGAAAERWSAALASGEDYETEFRIRRADGAYRWHLVRAIPLHGAEGVVSRWVGTNTDIHERKLAEAQNTRDRLRIWALSQELMMISDFDGVIAAVNPSATRMLGWSEEEMVGRALSTFLHPEDLQSTATELGKLSQGATTLAFENRYRTKDDGYRLLDWTAVPDGRRIHAVARDVTRERSAEDALRQAQKMEAVGQLTGGVAHDFNNLLTIIRTSIDLMRRPNVAEERRLRFMESISSAVNRAAKLTGQLLAFARRQALQPAVFDASQNVVSISDMLGTLVGSRIAVDVETPDLPCIVNADPSQFDTAIVNMAVNARDAMEGAGRLTIGVRRLAGIPAARTHPPVPGSFIAISLADTGSGIEPARMERIFEPFFTTKAVGLGTGLGLSQVFGFAKQSGGEIVVESKIGQGTTFTLYLPEAVNESRSLATAAEPPSLEDGHGERILVVEDNPEVAASVEETLHELGYAVVLARSADEALARLALDAQRFAAVFSDVVMAGMDGIDLAYEIRRRHALLPVLLSSGYSHVLAKDDAHGFDLLPKPYSLQALSRALREVIARRPSAPARRIAPIGALVESQADEAGDAERFRLTELEAMQILDSEEEAAYDDLTRMAATFCDAPIALISLIDRDRQWFKSRVGLQARETPREFAFCDHAIRQPGQVMVVNDATRDERFNANPLVTGDPNIRFYAGAPLVTAAGNAIGTVCVIDYEARQIDPKQLEMLQFLANQVVKRLEARRAELVGKLG